jgi:hypothetical protein
VPELIENVATQNTFVDQLQLGPVKNCKQISFVGLGQPFTIQLWKPNPADPNGNPVQEGITRDYPANGGDAFQGVSGIKFRSTIAGKPAQIYANLAYATDPLSLGSSITSAIIDSSGQIVPPATGMITGQVAAAGGIIAGTGFTVTVIGTGVYDITFSTPFASEPTIVANGRYNGAPVEITVEPRTPPTTVARLAVWDTSAMLVANDFNFIAVVTA